MLNSCKDTIKSMIEKDSETQNKVVEMKDIIDSKTERMDKLKSEFRHLLEQYEKAKKEGGNLKELVKLKDKQLQEQNDAEKLIKQMHKDNKEMRLQVTKKDFEMREVVKTLKVYSDEKTRLERELEKLHKENESLVGHKNPSQKIQHHLKIKEENNRLREQNFKLQEELRKAQFGRKMAQTFDLEQPANNNADSKALKKDNMILQENINRLVDHILTQPTKLSMNEHPSHSNKLKTAMEVVSLLSNTIHQKERDLKDISRDKKKLKSKLEIAEKEAAICKQQMDLINSNNNSQNNSYLSSGMSNFLTKSPKGSIISATVVHPPSEKTNQ